VPPSNKTSWSDISVEIGIYPSEKNENKERLKVLKTFNSRPCKNKVNMADSSDKLGVLVFPLAIVTTSCLTTLPLLSGRNWIDLSPTVLALRLMLAMIGCSLWVIDEGDVWLSLTLPLLVPTLFCGHIFFDRYYRERTAEDRGWNPKKVERTRSLHASTEVELQNGQST
jgi:hypothetical protein